jgi:hypothetical protein
VLRETTSRELKRRMCVSIWDKFWVTVFVELSHRIMFAHGSSVNFMDLHVCRTHAPPRPVARMPALLPRGTCSKSEDCVN